MKIWKITVFCKITKISVVLEMSENSDSLHLVLTKTYIKSTDVTVAEFCSEINARNSKHYIENDPLSQFHSTSFFRKRVLTTTNALYIDGMPNIDQREWMESKWMEIGETNMRSQRVSDLESVHLLNAHCGSIRSAHPLTDWVHSDWVSTFKNTANFQSTKRTTKWTVR